MSSRTRHRPAVVPGAMSLNEQLFRYLDHIGPTVPVLELHTRPQEPNLVALRHDVDHDLDLALEVAYWQQERNQRATYFVLHTAAYWQDERLIDKCLQLQDFGHEVGLHLNVLAEWWRGQVDDPGHRLRDVVDRLRSAGIDLTGVSAHGDRLCYDAGFSNHWLFADLRPSDPVTEESGRSAEGIKVEDPRYQLAYPSSHQLRRDDGQVLSLWQEPMARHGLTYHAAHVPVDAYFTDSGGAWTRSPDPLDCDLRRGRHQVLMHPVYYRGPTRAYFFLSTARAGSKWLTRVLDHGASVTARHEQTLNLSFRDGVFVEEKHTGEGFRALPHQPGQVRRLLADARTWVDQQILGDYAEANIYLVHVLDQLTRYFPQACLVHLHRHPYDVVRSLLERGWYDTPDDDRHPVLDVEGWDKLSQLEKACHYVRRVNEQLLQYALPRISLEEATTDLAAFESRLHTLGIATYPRLATDVWDEVVNAGRTHTVYPVEAWDRRAQRTLRRICGPVTVRLGYSRGAGFLQRFRAFLATHPARSNIHSEAPAPPPSPRLLLNIPKAQAEPTVRVTGGHVEARLPGELVIRPDGERHTLVFLGGGHWHRLDENSGFHPQLGSSISGHITLDTDDPNGFEATIFALLFDTEGELLSRRRLRNLQGKTASAYFSFGPPANCARFAFALYVPLRAHPNQFTVRSLELTEIPSVDT